MKQTKKMIVLFAILAISTCLHTSARIWGPDIDPGSGGDTTLVRTKSVSLSIPDASMTVTIEVHFDGTYQWLDVSFSGYESNAAYFEAWILIDPVSSSKQWDWPSEYYYYANSEAFSEYGLQVDSSSDPELKFSDLAHDGYFSCSFTLRPAGSYIIEESYCIIGIAHSYPLSSDVEYFTLDCT